MICHQNSQGFSNNFHMIETLGNKIDSQPDKRSIFYKTIMVPNHSKSMKISDSYQCLLCNRRFAQKSTYKNHSHTHEKHQAAIYVCNICNKSFSVPARLTRHYRTHTGEKPYKCEYCTKSFSVKENLSVHRRIHTKERPYRCNVCDSGFEHSGKLHRHMRIHTGERPHKCTICDKTFIQSGQLVIHMRTHTGEKPYLCKSCGKGFTCSKQLKVHSRTHTGEKPYKCDICGRSFGYNHVLKLHQVAHYGEKFYKCILCEKTFNSKKLMEAHMKSPSNCKIHDIAQLSSKTSRSINMIDQIMPYNTSRAELTIEELSLRKYNESKELEKKYISYMVSNSIKKIEQSIHHQSYQNSSTSFIKSLNQNLVIDNDISSTIDEPQPFSLNYRHSSFHLDKFNLHMHTMDDCKFLIPVISSTQSSYSTLDGTIPSGPEIQINSTIHGNLVDNYENIPELYSLYSTSHATDLDIVIPHSRNDSTVPLRKRSRIIYGSFSPQKNELETPRRSNSVIKFAKVDNTF